MNITATPKKSEPKGVKDYTKENGELTKKLFELSKAFGKSQKVQAREMRYMPTELCYYFHGKRIMHIEDAERIADYLGYEIKLQRKE